MSAPTPQPDPMTRLALELREQQNRLNALSTQACTMVGQDAAGAEPMLAQALQMTEEFFGAEENFLKQVPWGAQQLPDHYNSAREAKAQILMAQAQAATILLRYKDALAIYEQVLGLLDANHIMRPTVQMAIANLNMKALSSGAL
jgi:tetratricopeptide (TPR) repeat protein